MKRTRRFATAGDFKSVMFTLLISLILCTPLCGTEGFEKEVVKEDKVTVAYETREYNLAARSGISTNINTNAITYTPRETSHGEIRDKIDDTLVTNIRYIESNEEIDVKEEQLEKALSEMYFPNSIKSTDVKE